jgi:hypothetical protein
MNKRQWIMICAVAIILGAFWLWMPLQTAALAPSHPQPLQGCSSCPPPSEKRIYAPAIELKEAERCEIVLNSRSPNPIQVTPTFYTSTGDAVVGTPIQLQSAEIRFMNVLELLPKQFRNKRHWSGLALSYVGNVLEVWAQITFHGVGGGSVDETFNILEEPGSDLREAVWGMPKKGTAVIALGNSANVPIHTTAKFSNGDSEDFDIPAGVTNFIRRKGRDTDTDSIKLTTVGPQGSLRVAGLVIADDQSFTSSIRFYDTKKTVQPNLYATNLRVQSAVPRLILKNTSDATISARPRFFSVAGEKANPVELATMTLLPQQVLDVDLSELRAAAASRTDIDSVSVQVLNSGAPGSLIGAAYSREVGTQLTHDVPLRDSGKNRMGTGSYPWRVDRDYSTVVTITNVGNQPARFQGELRYLGGPYSIKPRELAVGETATFDLGKMRDTQQPDRLDHTLPRTLEQGQFHWSIVSTPGEAHIIGRAAVVSRSERVSSSYSCFVCCPDSGPSGGFNPSSYGVYVDGFEQTSSSGLYYDCYNNNYSSSIWWSSLSTTNSSIATINGSEQLYGVTSGGTYANGIYDSIVWWTDGMDCYPYNYSAGDNAPVVVHPHIDSISPDRGSVDSTVGISIVGTGFGSGSTVAVDGTGITASVQSSSSTSLSVTLTIAPNATAGNHGVTVTRSGNTSNSANFFVQIPTQLRRDSISGLQNEQGGCGATRSLQYTLLDQEGAPIDTSGTITEGISNYSGPSGAQPVENTASMNHGAFNDTVGYSSSPGCPSAFTATFTQTFTAALATQGYAWALSSQNAISMGRTSSGSKFVDITFTQ